MTLAVFAVAPPGLEDIVSAELRELGTVEPKGVTGGVELTADVRQLVRLNLGSRTATRFLVRLGSFPAAHPAELVRKAARLDWSLLPRSGRLRLRTSAKASRIYHTGAASERVVTAIHEATGRKYDVAPGGDDESVPDDVQQVFVRIERNVVTVSLDSSGEHLHRRGYRLASAKAPLRETLAAAFLRVVGFDGDVPFYDPMCGSGTLAIEAGLMACGIAPAAGRRLACERWPGISPQLVQDERRRFAGRPSRVVIGGSDRDEGAVAAANENAKRAGITASFQRAAVSDAKPLTDAPGLLMVNPPYGSRIGDPRELRNLYARLGQVARQNFAGYRVALITSDVRLAAATELGLTAATPPIDHGGIKVKLYVS